MIALRSSTKWLFMARAGDHQMPSGECSEAFSGAANHGSDAQDVFDWVTSGLH
jgi:hypothetical protein